MQIPIRLYRQHDMDLIRMYMNKSLRFTAEMKNAIISYANGKPYSIQITDSPPDYRGYLKISIMVHVSIDEKKYPEVTALFDKIKKGQRGSFIKALTRRCMTVIPLSTFFVGDGIIMSIEEAIKLEENGFVVEGNSLLVNKDYYLTKIAKAKKIKALKDAIKNSTQITQETSQLNFTISAQNSPPLEQKPNADDKEKESDNDSIYSPVDMYVPDDNIPSTEEIAELNPFSEPVSNDSENGESSNAIALFGKLAH